MHFITCGPSLEQLEERAHHNYWKGALWHRSMSTYAFMFVNNAILGITTT